VKKTSIKGNTSNPMGAVHRILWPLVLSALAGLKTDGLADISTYAAPDAL